MMTSLTRLSTTCLNARPMMKATATATRSPCITNFLKSFQRLLTVRSFEAADDGRNRRTGRAARRWLCVVFELLVPVGETAFGREVEDVPERFDRADVPRVLTRFG